MLTAMLALALLAAPEAPAPPPPLSDAKLSRADRTVALVKRIDAWKVDRARHSETVANELRAKGQDARANVCDQNRKAIDSLLAAADIEVRWLGGKLTTAGTAESVRVAEDALALAKKDGKPTTDAEKALALAMTEQKRVAELESFEPAKPAPAPSPDF